MSRPTLLHIVYSPWSERARWALEARHVEHDKRSYQPLVQELTLRRLTGRWWGTVSAPLLLTDNGVLDGGAAIARWANEHGDGPDLFPQGGEVDRWEALADDALAAGRARTLTRVIAAPDALRELTPKRLRNIGGPVTALIRAGTVRTRRKYGGHLRSDDEHLETLCGTLDAMRTALDGNPEATLLGTFSYADITCAQVLAFVHPHDGNFLRLGPANRRVYGDPTIAARYPDLIAWRDALYARHRTSPPTDG